MLGQRIKEERLRYNYSREVFAELVDITPQHLFNVESGRRRLSYEKLARVCEILNVTADYLLFGHPDSSVNTSKIVGLLKTLDPKHLEFAEELIITYIKGINLEKHAPPRNDH